jgi:hypothetical protein
MSKSIVPVTQAAALIVATMFIMVFYSILAF